MSGSKPKLVIFEGADKVGKTTLFKMFRAATHYIPLAIDRFTGSNFVYDRYYGRDTSEEAYLKSETEIQKIFDCYLIVLTADPKVIKDRILENETEKAKEIALENFDLINRGFLLYFMQDTRYKNAMILDTSKCTQEEALKKILEFTGEVNRNE
jgi:thymidylate kinase